MMLVFTIKIDANKRFGAIYFHFNIFSKKNSKIIGVKIYIFGFGEFGPDRVPERSISHYCDQ